MESRENKSQALYLTCEKYYIFELLIFAGGMMGAYTYNLRGGVFCNAQTANVVLMALAFGHGQWQKGFYYYKSSQASTDCGLSYGSCDCKIFGAC